MKGEGPPNAIGEGPEVLREGMPVREVRVLALGAS